MTKEERERLREEISNKQKQRYRKHERGFRMLDHYLKGVVRETTPAK